MAEVTKPILLDETGQAMLLKLQGIIDALTPDVTKAYVDAALGLKADKEPIQTSMPSDGILPDKFYSLGELTTDIDITFALGDSYDSTKYHEWKLQFVIGTTVPTITFPATLEWNNIPSFETGMTYQINITFIGGRWLGLCTSWVNTGLL